VDTSFPYDATRLPEYLDLLRTRARIAVVYGGDKNQPGAVIQRVHNPRDWKSYKHVACDIQDALKELGFGYVTLLPDDMRLPQRLADDGISLVWLNTGGVQGYNSISHAPAMLEMLGLPYIGHHPLNATLLDNKDLFKRCLQGLGIRTAPFITWHPAQGPLRPENDQRFRDVFGAYQGPFVVKPVSGRASRHVHLADTPAALPEVAGHVYAVTCNSVLIERYLSGAEYCVAVCGPITYEHGALAQHAAPRAFSALERLFEPGEMIYTSLDQRPITLDRLRLLGDDEQPVKHELLQLAQTIYQEFGLRSIVRVDVRSDHAGALHVLEVNPKPDLKRPSAAGTSLVMAGPTADGTSYTDVIFGLLADRLHHLLAYEQVLAKQIISLLSEGSQPPLRAAAQPPRFHAAAPAPADSVVTA